MKVLSERLITNAEALEILRQREKKGELRYEQKNALENLKKFAKLSAQQAQELATKLRQLPKLREKHIVALLNLLPQDREELRVVLYKDFTLFSDKELDQILEVLKKK